MKCCLCGKEIGQYGNNAEPLATGECCDKCNVEVIKERLKRLPVCYFCNIISESLEKVKVDDGEIVNLCLECKLNLEVKNEN